MNVESRFAAKRPRDEAFEELVDLIAADTTTTTQAVSQWCTGGASSSYDSSLALPKHLPLEVKASIRARTQEVDAQRGVTFLPQLTLEEGFHSKPLSLRITDLFTKKIGSGHVSADSANQTSSSETPKVNDPLNRKAVEIATSMETLIKQVPTIVEKVKHNELTFGSSSRLTAGFRRQVVLEKRYPKANFTPIILVPSAVSAPIQLFNVKDFLQRGVYTHPSGSYMNSANGSTNREDSKPENVMVSPTSFFSADVLAKCAFRSFRIVEDPRQVENWQHVCACIVTGAEWQFADWFPKQDPSFRTPSYLFDFMRGFLPYFEEDRIPAAVQQWKVHPIQLTRKYVKANGHIAQAFAFWEELYKFLETNPRFSHYTPTEDSAASGGRL